MTIETKETPLDVTIDNFTSPPKTTVLFASQPNPKEEKAAPQPLPDSLGQFFQETKGFDLLSKEQEKYLGKQIFEAKLALTNLSKIVDLLSPQQQTIVKDILSKPRSKLLMETLDRKTTQMPKRIEKLKKENKSTSGEEGFDEDVGNNRQMMKNKLKEFDSTKDKGEKQQLISSFTNLQLRLFHQGDKAFDEFIYANLSLVSYTAKTYQGKGFGLNDLIGFGNEGLIEAIAEFNYRKDNKFSTIATISIVRSISKAILEYPHMIRLPREQIGRINEVEKQKNEKKQDPTDPNNSQILLEKAILAKTVLSLDLPLSGDSDSLKLGDLLADTTNESVEEKGMKNALYRDLRKLMASSLDPLRRTIVNMRFGFTDGKKKSLPEIADELSLPPKKVKELSRTALKQLRKDAKEIGLKDYLID